MSLEIFRNYKCLIWEFIDGIACVTKCQLFFSFKKPVDDNIRLFVPFTAAA